VFEENGVRDAAPGEGWAGEFAASQPAPAGGWASEYEAGVASRRAAAAAGPAGWAGEFASRAAVPVLEPPKLGEFAAPGDTWAAEFSSAADEWAEEYESGDGALPGVASDEWLETYQRFVEEHDAVGAAGARVLGPQEYEFSAANPFDGDPSALARGRELLHQGVLSEAVLALEAAAKQEEGAGEAWRLLGQAHAENDDDRRAISAVARALRADPGDREALLAMSVSLTNELDQATALGYMQQWLEHHPDHAGAYAAAVGAAGAMAQPTHARTLALFEAAAARSPGDADLHVVLGVLHNMSGQYDAAAAAFDQALRLRPTDYSLWNKLGATRANGARSGEALPAYRHALDLKPSYVRAWCNMGIGYANQADYDQSLRYYIRALAMNPRAENIWGYVRLSLASAGRADLLPAAEAQDLAALEAAFPL